MTEDKWMGGGMTWQCWACKESRPDDKISVITIDLSEEYKLPIGSMKLNTKYCNDRRDCLDKAQKRNKI